MMSDWNCDGEIHIVFKASLTYIVKLLFTSKVLWLFWGASLTVALKHFTITLDFSANRHSNKKAKPIYAWFHFLVRYITESLDLLSNTYSVPSFQRQPHIKNHSTKVLLKQSYVKVYPYILFNIIMQQMQKLSLKKKLTHPVTFVSNCPFTSTYTYN